MLMRLMRRVSTAKPVEVRDELDLCNYRNRHIRLSVVIQVSPPPNHQGLDCPDCRAEKETAVVRFIRFAELMPSTDWCILY